jgi:drug/metabolite transporter (DMT)-like permease
MGRHPPRGGRRFLYLGFAASDLVVVLVAGLEWPNSPGGSQALLFGAGALTATLFSYSVPRLGPSCYAILANCELNTVVLIGSLIMGEDLSPGRAI